LSVYLSIFPIDDLASFRKIQNIGIIDSELKRFTEESRMKTENAYLMLVKIKMILINP